MKQSTKKLWSMLVSSCLLFCNNIYSNATTISRPKNYLSNTINPIRPVRIVRVSAELIERLNLQIIQNPVQAPISNNIPFICNIPGKTGQYLFLNSANRDTLLRYIGRISTHERTMPLQLAIVIQFLLYFANHGADQCITIGDITAIIPYLTEAGILEYNRDIFMV